jgi:CRP-like cAMP-binding protein
MFEAALEDHAFFKTLPPPLLEELAGMAQKASYEKGQYIFHEDGHADRFYAIHAGKVSVELPVPGREPVSILTLGDHDVLGWSWLFPPYRWRFDARAVEAAKLYVFDGARLRRRCEENHELGFELMRRVAQVAVQALLAERRKIADLSGPVTAQFTQHPVKNTGNERH